MTMLPKHDAARPADEPEPAWVPPGGGGVQTGVTASSGDVFADLNVQRPAVPTNTALVHFDDLDGARTVLAFKQDGRLEFGEGVTAENVVEVFEAEMPAYVGIACYVARVEHERAALVHALKPFAADAALRGKLGLGRDIDHWPIGGSSLTLGDLRKAKVVYALARGEGQQ